LRCECCAFVGGLIKRVCVRPARGARPVCERKIPIDVNRHAYLVLRSMPDAARAGESSSSTESSRLCAVNKK
jgi:hypothetical protein